MNAALRRTWFPMFRRRPVVHPGTAVTRIEGSEQWLEAERQRELREDAEALEADRWRREWDHGTAQVLHRFRDEHLAADLTGIEVWDSDDDTVMNDNSYPDTANAAPGGAR